MNHLLRGQAPISDAGWQLLDDEARERLTGPLAARRLVDFTGPLGWEHSATNLGRTEELASPNGEGVVARRRRVLPLVELRADFAVSRSELRDGDRGAVDVDLESLDEAARQIAVSENVAVFHGWAEAGDRRHRRDLADRARAARRQRRRVPAPGRARGRGDPQRAASRAPTGWRWDRRSTPG